MLNTVTVWRPFKSIKKSVASLSLEDLREAKLTTSQVILCFLNKLGLDTNNTPDLTVNNINIKFYWNNGKPFFYDLIWYYAACHKRWSDEGGDPIDFLEDKWDAIYSYKGWENKSTWKISHSTVHAFKLMECNHFWYQRFFVSDKNDVGPWRYRKLIDRSLYVDGKLRRIRNEEVKTVTERR